MPLGPAKLSPLSLCSRVLRDSELVLPHTLQRNAAHVEAAGLTNVISLLNMKGGVGKTTLAVNLAWHTFRRNKKRVLLVDLDPQFNASQYMMHYDVYSKHVKTNGTGMSQRVLI